MKKVLKVLEAIICGSLAFIGAICLTPFVLIYFLISLPAAVIDDVLER